MLRSQAWNLAKTWMKETPKNPTLTCPVRTQWRGISLAQGALCPQVPHPLLQRHQMDWEGRGARVPADAGGGQDSRVKRHGCSPVRVPAVSQATATAGCGSLGCPCSPMAFTSAKPQLPQRQSCMWCRYQFGHSLSPWLPFCCLHHHPSLLSCWLSPEPLARCCAHNQKTSRLLQCVVLGSWLFLFPGSVLVIQKRD